MCWAPTWTQGFEQNLNGWYARIPRLGGGPGDLEPATRAMRRRPANNIPIPPASGAFVGQLYGQVDAIDFNSVAALTTWGGYKQTLPAGGYTVSLDVYLAPIEHDDPNALFTYAVTATNPDTCQPVGDVFFRAGNQTEGNETLFCVSINDNGPKGPACEGPATIIFDRDPSSSGWYTFVVEYFANTVANQMTARAYVTLLNGQNTLPVTFVVPGGYGGNQYAWFPYINAFDAVYIDNAVRTSGGVSPT